MKIVVLAGGTSTERSVSITSGTMVCKALREKNHQAVLVDVFCGIDVKGNLEDVFAEEAYDIDKAAEYMHSFDAGLNEMIESRRRFFGPNVLELCEAADVVFLALHGANGEDGKVQATFDLLGIPYTGTGHAVVGDNDVHALARGGDSGDIGADGRDTALQQRSDDDGALCTLCGIGMAALCTGDDAVRADNDVAVEVGIHFQGSQNDVIQLVDERALVHRACILARRDGEMVGVGADVIDSVQVKVLGIHQLAC